MEAQVPHKFVLCLRMSNLPSWIHVTINTMLWKLKKYYEQNITLTAIVSAVFFLIYVKKYHTVYIVNCSHMEH